MKTIITLLFTLFLVGCEDFVSIPLNTIERANEMCSTLDGVKQLKVYTYCVTSGKFCTNDMVTEVSVVCYKYDTNITTDIKWSRE
jgi:hypothetical protein